MSPAAAAKLLEACKRLLLVLVIAGLDKDPSAEFAREAIKEAEA